jgi:hypothetical protein
VLLVRRHVLVKMEALVSATLFEDGVEEGTIVVAVVVVGGGGARAGVIVHRPKWG